MVINSFEDIIAWQKAKELSIAVYKLLSNSKDRGFKDQLERASVSVMNNIAEGFERQSNQEFRKFLYIAKGSCGEVRSMLRLGEELGSIPKHKAEKLISLATETSKIISGLIKNL